MKKSLIAIAILFIITISLDYIFKDQIILNNKYENNIEYNLDKIEIAKDSSFINDEDKIYKVLLLSENVDTNNFIEDLFKGKYKLNIDKLYILSLNSEIGFITEATTTSIVNFDNNMENINFEYDYLKYFDK